MHETQGKLNNVIFFNVPVSNKVLNEAKSLFKETTEEDPITWKIILVKQAKMATLQKNVCSIQSTEKRNGNIYKCRDHSVQYDSRTAQIRSGSQETKWCGCNSKECWWCYLVHFQSIRT